MKNTSIKTIIFIICYSLLITSVSFSQDEDAGFLKKMLRRIFQKREVKEDRPKEKIEQKEPPAPLTKEAMLDIINNNLYIFGEELSSRIPNLVTVTDEEGNILYKYKKDEDQILGLEDLDEETISGLYRKVLNESNLLRSERLNVQLQQSKQIQRPPQVPPTPPQPVRPPPTAPKPYTPPKTPQPPRIPTQQR